MHVLLTNISIHLVPLRICTYKSTQTLMVLQCGLIRSQVLIHCSILYCMIQVLLHNYFHSHSRCLELDPGNLPAHMSLAVCYTNESQQIKVQRVPVASLPALEAEFHCYHSNAHSQCEVYSM